MRGSPFDTPSRPRANARNVAGVRKIDLRSLFGLPSSSGFKIPFGNSLMIEGGASVISSSLASPGLVDLVVITVAPVLVGEGISMIGDGVRRFFRRFQEPTD